MSATGFYEQREYQRLAPVPALVPQATTATSISALPAVVDLALYRGDDFYLTVDVTDPGGAPFDLTGYTATAQIRLTPDTTDPPLASFTATISTSTIHLHLDDVSAAKLSAACVWDLQVRSPDSDVTTLAYGKVAITLDVTRP